MKTEKQVRTWWIRPDYKRANVFYCTNNLMRYAGYKEIVQVIPMEDYRKLQAEVEELKEYRAMYEGLCK